MYRKQRSIGLPFVSVIIALLGCGKDENGNVDASYQIDIPDDSRSTQIEPFPDNCSMIESVLETNQARHPGSGSEIVLRIKWKDEIPDTSKDYRSCIGFSNPGRTRQRAVQVAKRSIQNHRTSLVIVPGSAPEENQRVLQAANAFLTSRPENEPIAIYRWAGRVTQVSAFKTDRRLLSRLIERGIQPSVEPLARQSQAISYLLEISTRISGKVLTTMTSLVVIAPTVQLDDPVEINFSESPMPLFWLAGRFSGQWLDALPMGWRFTATDSEDLSVTVQRLSDQMDIYLRESFYTIGYCLDERSDDLSVVVDGRAVLDIKVEENLPEESVGSCNAWQIAQGIRRYPDTVEFIFSAAERTVFDQYIATKDKQDFTLHVALWPENAPIASKGHLRGSSSLKCNRKGFTINLGGSKPRFLMPRSAKDKYHLLSLCLDNYYIQTSIGYRLMSRLDLFPLRHRYVELKMDGKSQGVYILVEHITDQLRVAIPLIKSIVRRRQDQGGVPPEVKWSLEPTQAALDNYEAIISSISDLAAERLERVLDSQMDLDQYLRWIGLMSLLQNGDYVDEVYFYSTETIDETGSESKYYSILGWDTDDLFAPCHHEQSEVFNDPNDLLFCTESLLDRVIFADSYIYSRYLEILEALLLEITDQVFRETLDDTLNELMPYLDDPQTCSAMTEITRLDSSATDPNSIKRSITEEADRLMKVFTERRHRFLQKVQALR